MKLIILTDNVTNSELQAEWGFSAYIEYKDKKILLDAGQSDIFLQNAKALEIDLAQVDYGVLSHGHYDHADGMGYFFENNRIADFYLRKTADARYYHRKTTLPGYIGINRSILKKYTSRIRYVEGDYHLTEGVWLIPHKTDGLEEIGRKAVMYRRDGLRLIPDDYSHEQSLVFDTPKGLVICNSCSHGGADNIIREIRATLPDKKIHALIGGLHLYRSSDEDVRALAGRIRDVGIKKIYTGHCTGERAVRILQEELGDCVETFYTGMRLDFH